jgi:hypothetical protein
MATETCKALEILEKSEIIDIDGRLLSSWYLGTLDCEDDEAVFKSSYTDSEGNIYEYSFSKKTLMEASILGNRIIVRRPEMPLECDECYIVGYVLSEVKV